MGFDEAVKRLKTGYQKRRQLEQARSIARPLRSSGPPPAGSQRQRRLAQTARPGRRRSAQAAAAPKRMAQSQRLRSQRRPANDRPLDIDDLASDGDDDDAYGYYTDEYSDYSGDEPADDASTLSDDPILFFMDVNLGLGRAGRLGVRAGDDPDQLAAVFGSTYDLDDVMVDGLADLVRSQLEAFLQKMLLEDRGEGDAFEQRMSPGV